MSLVENLADVSGVEVNEVCTLLGVDVEHGLNAKEVEARVIQYGRNELAAAPPTPFWCLVLAQFDDILVRILLLAAMVSFAMAIAAHNRMDLVEPFIILLILTLNAIVGVWQENRAEDAIAALREYVPDVAVVVRDGVRCGIHSQELVPGDVVHVNVGDRVPADIRVLRLESTTLRVDESILNGESEETMKQVEAVTTTEVRFPANMIFSGTAVVYGRAVGVVVRTGAATEIGRIERDVREQEEVRPPLQLKLDEFGVLLSKVIGYICLAVFLIDLTRWYAMHPRKLVLPSMTWYEYYVLPALHCIKVAVALAVAAIPEGLPAVVTTCLALGTRRMARHNALVRDLPSVETLGRCTVICSDKTGTLTTNMMSVTAVTTLDRDGAPRTYTLPDSRYKVIAHSVRVNDTRLTQRFNADCALEWLAQTAVLCNDAALHVSHSGHDGTTRVTKVGEATEAALLVLAEKLACGECNNSMADNNTKSNEQGDVQAFRIACEATWCKKATLEFTRTRKSMSVCCTRHLGDGEMEYALFVKGAPEELLRRARRVMLADGTIVALNEARRVTLTDAMNDMTCDERALRCIGFAFKSLPPIDTLDLADPNRFELIEDDLTYLGICGMLDPPRPEIRDAITSCHTAGIRVIVITGDKKETAEAVCRQIGLLQPGPIGHGVSFTGDEFDALLPSEKRAAVMSAVVFSRTDPSHKMQLVRLLQEQQLICAMTGDGVNDSPALKRADIGIAMGSGTEVAKSASKMILADDNFSTIVKAVKEGRCIYNNTKQFIRYLISSNIGEVACVLVTGLCGLPDALSPIQLLWVNLVTDGLPATALSFNVADPDIMHEAPRDVREPIVNGWLFVRYMIVGTYIGLATVAGFVWWFLSHGFTMHELLHYSRCTDMQTAHCRTLADPRAARSVALSILVVVEMLNALNALSENQSITVTRPSSNVWLILAVLSSLLLHVTIMYVPFFADMFSIAPLGVHPALVQHAAPWSVLIPTDLEEWKAVMVFSVPVIFIDEVIKYLTRRRTSSQRLPVKRA